MVDSSANNKDLSHFKLFSSQKGKPLKLGPCIDTILKDISAFKTQHTSLYPKNHFGVFLSSSTTSFLNRGKTSVAAYPPSAAQIAFISESFINLAMSSLLSSAVPAAKSPTCENKWFPSLVFSPHE